MAAIEVERYEDILKARYLRYAKILLILGLIYTLWVVIVVVGTYFFSLGGSRWAFLPMTTWVYSWIIVLALCVGIEAFFIVHEEQARKQRIEEEKPAPLRGKKLYVYTAPEIAKGGIFAKTYVKVDENSAVAIRYQMMNPQQVWKKEF